jgi:hypothetical protein
VKELDGDEWQPVAAAATRVGVAPSTIRTWVDRGKVETCTIRRLILVRMADVWDAEHATRGRYVAQRLRRVRQ